MGEELIKHQPTGKQPIGGVKVADGSIMTNYGFHKLRVVLPGGRLFDIEALITTGDQCLLGMPFLQAGEALIDVATGWIRINDFWYCTQQRRTRYIGSVTSVRLAVRTGMCIVFRGRERVAEKTTW